MTALELAWRTTKRYRTRAMLAIAGVAIIGALNFDMILLSHGLLASFTDMLNAAGFDVRIVGSRGLPMTRMPVEQAAKLAEELRRLPGIEEVVLVRLRPASVSVASRPPQDVTLIGTTQSSRPGAWTLLRGTDLPEGDHQPSPPPLIVARRLARLLDLGPGSPLKLRARIPGAVSALPSVAGRVTGIADFSFESVGDYSVATTMEGFQTAYGGSPGDEADLVLVRSRAGVRAEETVAAIGTLRPDLHAYSNEQVIAEFNRNGFTYFRQISIVLSTTTSVFAFLLAATVLTVSVNQRLGEVAGLRALGIARRRIASMLLWESALIVGTGGVGALPLGAALAVELDHILRRMPGLPERLHFFVYEPRALALHAALLLVTAVVAAVYPVWIATRLPIAQTLRREIIS
jgi:putative ABC transport system permease protein